MSSIHIINGTTFLNSKWFIVFTAITFIRSTASTYKQCDGHAFWHVNECVHIYISYSHFDQISNKLPLKCVCRLLSTQKFKWLTKNVQFFCIQNDLISMCCCWGWILAFEIKYQTWMCHISNGQLFFYPVHSIRWTYGSDWVSLSFWYWTLFCNRMAIVPNVKQRVLMNERWRCACVYALFEGKICSFWKWTLPTHGESIAEQFWQSHRTSFRIELTFGEQEEHWNIRLRFK